MGQIFLEHVPRVFAAISQARDSVKAIAAGHHGQLRIALSDSVSQTRLTALLALCREERPHVDTRLYEGPFAQQVKGLSGELYDAGFAQCADVDDGLIVVPAWSDLMVVTVPARHPLLVHKRSPLEEVLRYPLLLCDPDACEGCSRPHAKMLRTVDREPLVAEQLASHELMLTLVAAGFGLGFAAEAHVSACNHPDIVTRPLAAPRHRATEATAQVHRTSQFGLVRRVAFSTISFRGKGRNEDPLSSADHIGAGRRQPTGAHRLGQFADGQSAAAEGAA